MVSAQQSVRTSISGVVVDAETGETLPFVQIYYLKSTTSQGMVPSGKGTTSDMDGNFRISSSEGYTTLTFQMLGYKTEMVTLRKGQTRTNAMELHDKMVREINSAKARLAVLEARNAAAEASINLSKTAGSYEFEEKLSGMEAEADLKEAMAEARRYSDDNGEV